MLSAFQQLYKDAHPRIPARLQTDVGKEFQNKHVDGFLKHEGLHHFVPKGDQNAAVVDRFNIHSSQASWHNSLHRQDDWTSAKPGAKEG